MTRRENFELLHSRALERLSNDREAFADYLIYSARFFKLDVSQVVALFEDNPNATMVADEQTWRSFGRVIKKNGWATEVMISDGETKPNGFKKLYDISMTDSKEPKPYQWTFDKELAESFVKKTSQSERRDFDRVSDCLDYLATNAAEEQYEKLSTEINVPKDREDVFKKSYMSMVRRVVAARCEMNSNYNYISSADAEVNLQALDCISGTKDLENLIEQVHSAASKVLWSMEKSISNINIERSVIYDRNRGTEGLDRGGSSSDRRGSSPSVVRGGREVLSVAENAQEPSVSAEREAVHLRGGNVYSGLDTAGGGTDARTDKRVRENVAELYEGEPPVRHTDPTDERAVGVNPAQDRPDSSGYVRHDERGISEDSSRTRPQRYESDIHLVGATDELSQGEDIRGTSVREVDSGRLGGVDEQVSNNNNETAELENSAVDLSENHVTSSLSAEKVLLMAEQIRKNEQESKNFAEQFDLFTKNMMNESTVLSLGETPLALQIAGAYNYPLSITQSCIKNAMNPSYVFMHGHSSGHEIKREQIERLPEMLRTPIIIVEDDSSNLRTIIDDKGANGDYIMCHITLNKQEGRCVVNRVASIHEKRELADYITRSFDDNKVKALNTEKAESVFQSIGCQSSKEENFISFNNSIAFTTEFVKGEIEKNQNFFDNHERKQTVQFGLLGNGITVYDTSKTDPKANDYLTIAHISDEGNIKYYVDTNTINAEDITRIETQANEQKAKFTEQWNALTTDERYQKIFDGANALPAPHWDIFLADNRIMRVEEIIKKYEHPIVFRDGDFPQAERTLTAYRVGDFYELYGEAAQTVADRLNLTLTSRKDVPMVGIPAHAFNRYKRELAMQGYYVAQGDEREIDDPDYYEIQQLNEREAREEAMEKEIELITAVRGGAVAKIEEKPSEVSSAIPVENARANKISNIRLVYNDDSGFHLIADTDKVNDAVITVFGQNELEVRDYLNQNAVSTTIERGENGVTYNTESAESKAEEEEPVQSAEFSDDEPKYEQQSVFDMDTEREDIETPVEINNLAQLKRALTIGAEFEITSYIHTDTVNQLRRVNYVDTTGIYSIRPDKPDDEVSVANGGRGYYLQWGHASEWEFSNGNCTLYRFDTEHTPENALMSVRVKPRIIEKTTELRDETEREEQDEPPVKLKDLIIDLTPHSEREEQRIDPPVEKHNFTITDEHLGEGGAKAKFNANVEAIRTLQKIESENRLATPAEQEVLSKYVGWGGIPQAFDVSNQQWAKEYSELKSVLSDDEYAAARHSTMNAHYTSPTVIEAIYSALDRFGIKGGNVLEPAMGIGNFFGVMPEQMRANSQLFGVELDDITGRIAKQLYQNANIQVCGYENSMLSDNFFDVAIGNVPFGDYGVVDTRYNRENFLIHDYFFAKTLDKVAPNGIVAFITSKGTLDKTSPKVREYLAKRADLIGAIRLPNNAFKANAGTEVTSDIIFLQKREKMAVEMPDWVYTAPNEDGININQYFVNHPEMVLGVMKQGVEYSMHGNPNETACVPVEGANLREQLQVAVKMLERDVVTEMLDKSQDKQAGVIPATSDIHNFTFGIVDGKIYYRENNIMTEERLSDKAAERVRGLIEVRNTFRELLDAQADGSRSDEDISALREKLNSQYDVFTAKYGAISSINNKRVFSKDDTYDHLCGSLEHVNSQTKEISKSDIFTKRTVKPFVEITHVDTPAEGLSVSLDLRGRVDIGYIAELCGQEDNEVINSLIENDLIYKNPETEQYEETAEYLSGYVRDKLLVAQKAAIDNPEYERNVAALNKALPPTIGAEDIYVRIGASWIDNDDYCDFFREYAKGIISTASYSNRAVLSRLPSGEYKIDNKTADTSVAALNSFGTTRMSSYAIFENLLNNRNIAIYDYYEAPDGKRKREFNKDETQLVQEKARQMKEAFPKWLWENAQRRDKYVERYNTLFNSVVGRSFDGSHQVFAGMNPNIELAPHQKDAVMRCKLGGNTLLAHCVGAGKSFEMVTAVMEKRRLGLVNKACVVLPKHLVGQMAAEWSRLYPNARLLTAKETDFNKANRRKFIGRCCTGEYDAVLMSYEQFHRIPMSKEYEMSFVQDQIKTLDDAIRDATPKGVYIDAGTRRTIKRLESEKEKLKVKVTKLLSSPRDNSISFEQLGFDCLVVDEAHNYKNGLIVTKMNNVAGLGSSAAAKSVDFLMKTKYLNEKTGERNIILATGTPISNSMTELYILQQYMRPSGLERRGLQNFDDWASTFGEVVSEMSLKPAGNGFQNKNKFAKFCNYDELMLMYHDFADIRNADDLQLPVPEIEGGKPQTVSAKPNEFQKAYVQILAERSEAIHNGVVSDPRVDNMLKITGEARLLGLDARCINPEAENDPNSKVNMLIQKVMEIYTETTEQKGVQAIFCDIAINGGKMPAEITVDSESEETVEDNSEPEQGFNAEKLSEAVAPSKFSVYDYIKSELIRRGIPENEICFAGDAKNQSQRNTMYGELRDGQKRIILASTTKLGTGANIQTRLCALHNLDIPWRPSDFEQRQGRIVRQGNTFPTVKIYNYVTEGTFDAYMLDLIVTKQKFISQVMSGKTHARICEDVDESVLNYSEMQAIATGDPRIKEKIELDVEVSRLKLLESEYNKKRYEFDDMETRFKAGLSIAKNKLSLALDDKAFAEKNVLPEGEFKIKLNGKIYTERKDAGKELRASMMRFLKDKQAITIGEYRGFTISLNWGMVSYGQSGISANLRQGKGLTYTASDLGLDNDIGCITRIENVIKLGIDKQIAAHQSSIENTEKDLEEVERTKALPFEHAAELAEKSTRLEQLNNELGVNKVDNVVFDETLDENETERGSETRTAEPEPRKDESIERKPLKKVGIRH